MIFEQIFNMINQGILILDKDLTVSHWNRWLENHSRISVNDAVGRSVYDLFPDLRQPWFIRNCKAAFAFGSFSFFSHKTHEYLFPLKQINMLDAEFDLMRQDCTMGPLRDESNVVSHIYITIQDVTEVAAYQRKLHELNVRDTLTGAFNRRYFEEQFGKEMARHRRYDHSLSLVMFDIDHFKNINDTYGHQAGDYVLAEFSSIIRERVRSSDIFVRYGGEEFCCILTETNCDDAFLVAESLRSIIADHKFFFEETVIPVTVSLGVSQMNEDDDVYESIVKRADTALYEAKETGRNKTVAC